MNIFNEQTVIFQQELLSAKLQIVTISLSAMPINRQSSEFLFREAAPYLYYRG